MARHFINRSIAQIPAIYVKSQNCWTIYDIILSHARQSIARNHYITKLTNWIATSRSHCHENHILHLFLFRTPALNPSFSLTVRTRRARERMTAVTKARYLIMSAVYTITVTFEIAQVQTTHPNTVYLLVSCLRSTHCYSESCTLLLHPSLVPSFHSTWF